MVNTHQFEHYLKVFGDSGAMLQPKEDQ